MFGTVAAWSIGDAEGGVFVAPDGVGARGGPDVEVLDLGAEVFACAAREREGVGAAGGVEGEVYASAVGCPTPGRLAVVSRCGCVSWAPEERVVKHGFREAVDEVATAVLC